MKLSSISSNEPVQTVDTAIPCPPEYRSRDLNTPRVQDVTDPAIRTSLFGRFAQIDHHGHYGSGYDEIPNLVPREIGCAGIQCSPRREADDSVDSVHPSSTCFTKDDPRNGGQEDSSPRSHGSSG
jgi:hypothetical protein